MMRYRAPRVFFLDPTPQADVETPAPLQVPPVDIVEEPGGWRLVFEMPGAVADRLRIDVKGRLVLVRAERRPTGGECGRYLRVERAAGPFERTLELPDEADAENAKATFVDGLLTLEIPRAAVQKARQIPIQKGGKGT